jgi:uncharacterized membrane protein
MTLRSKTGFIVGIALISLGIVMVLANALSNGYTCNCLGQPNTCVCDSILIASPLSYYYPDIVGLVVSILGLAIVIYSIRKPEV